jgi:hypothetical protein
MKSSIFVTRIKIKKMDKKTKKHYYTTLKPTPGKIQVVPTKNMQQKICL